MPNGKTKAGVGSNQPPPFISEINVKSIVASTLIIVSLLLALCIQASADEGEGRGFVVDIKNAEAVGRGVSVKGARADVEQDEVDVLRQFDDEAIFIDIAGQDRVKWKLLRDEMEDIVNGFPHRPEMDEAAVRNARKVVFNSRLSKLLRNYVKYAVFAVEARKHGITVPESAFVEQRDRMKQELDKKGAAGRRQLARITALESLYEHNLTNALLWQAYAEKVVRPTLVITAEEIAARVEKQHADNEANAATNAFKRTLVADLRKRLKSDPSAFAALAEKWSDCPSSDLGGVLTDVNDQPQRLHKGDLRPEVEQAYDKLKPGEMSDVVETPYSWHIIKLLARHPKTEDEDASVEIAHIMLEKVPLLPELTAEQARHKIENKKLREAMAVKLLELLKTTKIDCLIPLQGDSTKPGRKIPRKRVIKEGD